MLRLAVVDERGAFEHDQQLDVGVAVQSRTLSRTGVDEQHARSNAAVLLAHEVPRDDVLGQLLRAVDLDRQAVSVPTTAVRNARCT